MECQPPASAGVLNVDFPALMATVPSVALPSVKVTAPVAAEGVSVAVKVTDEPYIDGSEDALNLTVVLTVFTVCVSEFAAPL